jgi:hypothetical protein
LYTKKKPDDCLSPLSIPVILPDAFSPNYQQVTDIILFLGN